MSDQLLEMKRGDTAPKFRAQLLDGSTPVNLSSALSARLLIRNSDGALIVDGAVMIESGTAGWVNRAWQTGDTAVAESDGRGEVEVTWNDNTTQTFPRDGYFAVVIYSDLG
jgi:hypothetical protein